MKRRVETGFGILMTRLSSKGQLVIPKDLRSRLGIKEGDLLGIMKTKEGLIVLKKIKSPILKKDLRTLYEIGRAWHEIETGKYKRASASEFLKVLSKW